MKELEKILEELKTVLEQNIVKELNGNGTVDKYSLNPWNTWSNIEELIRKHMNDGWIPVEERLPKEHDSIFAKWKGTDKWSKSMFEKISGDVNVTVEYEDGERKTITAHTVDGKWVLPNRIIKQKVIAWRPLPDPYHPERSERK